MPAEVGKERRPSGRLGKAIILTCTESLSDKHVRRRKVIGYASEGGLTGLEFFVKGGRAGTAGSGISGGGARRDELIW